MSSEIPGGAAAFLSKNTSPCVCVSILKLPLLLFQVLSKLQLRRLFFPSLAIKFDKSISFQHNEENHRQVKNIFLDVLCIQKELIADNGQN